MEQEQELLQPSTSKTQAELRIEKSQHATLSRKFIDAMNAYRNAEIEYRERCKARIQRQLEISEEYCRYCVLHNHLKRFNQIMIDYHLEKRNYLDETGRSVTEGEVEEMLESGNPAVFTQGIMVETAQAKQSLADIEARHGDIMKLEKNIRELRDMFIDMAALVQTQGEMIDRIEYNVVQSENFVKAASTDTKKAVKFQSAARRKKILLILCLIITVVIIVLILVIYFVVTKKNSSSNSPASSTAAPNGQG
ncbi:unnamed protein product [Rotaria sp. Silwood2]|nr:unnamed protein product [Rotaria sp. Silwood2]